MKCFAKIRMERAGRLYEYGHRREAYQLMFNLIPDVVKEMPHGPPQSQAKQSLEETGKEK